VVGSLFLSHHPQRRPRILPLLLCLALSPHAAGQPPVASSDPANAASQANETVGHVGAVSFRVVASPAPLPNPAADPKYDWKFPYRAAVYVGAMRRFSVYYQEREDAALAVRVADLLGRLHAAADRLPLRPFRPAEIRVWLPRSGQAGGEQYRDSIYLYAVAVPRGDAEWVREVAHELGHLVLPSFAHYDAPEPMENGYLGERLLPKWLLELGERSVWDGRVLLTDYLRGRLAPLCGRFLDAGPGSALRLDRSAAGMDYAIGMVLTLEAQHGPEFLSRVMARTIGTGMESLLLAYREEVTASDGYRIPAELAVPGRSKMAGVSGGQLRFEHVAYRAYLPSGRWTLTLHGERLAGVKASLDGQRLTPGGGKDPHFSLSTDVSRWHLIQLEATGSDAGLRELELTAATRPAAVAGRSSPGASTGQGRAEIRREREYARRAGTRNKAKTAKGQE
jgi:hypothetical protein